MVLDYSVINTQPVLGFANFSYDVGSAITEYVRSAPIGSQVEVRVTNLTSGTSTLLQEGTDYYTGADGEIVINRSVVPYGAQVSFSLDTDFNNFYDDFSDLGAAPAGPVKRRTQQLQNMALQLRDRIETLESGDIDVDLTETTITAGNVTYGPGDFQIGTANGVQVTDLAGTGFQIGLNYGTIFADPLVTSAINDATQAYIEANPPASGVVTVSGRSPDGAGNIDLAATDVSGLDAVATSGDYSDLTNTPQDLSEFNNDEGFIGTADVTNIFNAINDKLDKSELDGGTTGQVLKKMSNTDGDYAWGTDTGGGSGTGATQLGGLDDVDLTLSSVTTGQGFIYNGTKWVNQTLTHNDISDFDTEVDARITASNPFDGDYNSLINTPTLRTDAEVRTLADEQITASSPFDGNYNSLSNKPDLSGITTNASDIATNTSAIAGKFDEPSGTPSTGDVIEWDGSQAAWATPSSSSGGGIQFWQIDFGLVQALDGGHSNPIGPNLNGTEMTNGSFGSYSVSGSTPTFTFSSAGTYKVTMSLDVITTLAPIRDTIDMSLNGTVVSRVGLAAEGTAGFSGTLDPGGTMCSSRYFSISSSDVLTLSGDLRTGTWIIEKVG